MNSFRYLTIIHTIEFLFFFALATFIFYSPQIDTESISILSDLDLFYEFIVSKSLEVLGSNYIIPGIFTFLLSFLALFCAFITHSKSRSWLIFNYFYSLVLALLFPVGTIFSFLSLPALYNIRKGL